MTDYKFSQLPVVTALAPGDRLPVLDVDGILTPSGAGGGDVTITAANLLASRARRSAARRKSRYLAAPCSGPSMVVSGTQIASSVFYPASSGGVVTANPPWRSEGAGLTAPFGGANWVQPFFAGTAQFISWRVSFDFYGLQFGAAFFGGGYEFNVWIDDAPISSSPTTLANDSAVHWANVTLPALGQYRVTFEMTTGAGSSPPYFGGLAALATYDIRVPADPSPLRIVVVGDSYGEGRGGDGISASPNPSSIYGYTSLLSQLLGVPDLWTMSVGGTGYVAAGSTSPYSGRSSDVIAAAPDVVIVQGSINDGSLSGVTAAAESFVSGLQASLPNAVIILTGPLYVAAYYSAITTTASQISAAATAQGVKFIDASTWATGTGDFGTPTGDGTADYYRNNDATHPTPAGHQMLAERLAAAVGPLLGLDVAEDPAVTVGGAASDIQPAGVTALAGSSGRAADALHVHPWSSAEPLVSGETILQRLFPYANVPLTAGQMMVTAWTAVTSGSVTTVTLNTGSTAASGLTYCEIAVYSVNAAGTATRLATTGDVHASNPLNSTFSTTDFSLAFTRTAGQRYALGIIVAGTTLPSLQGLFPLFFTDLPWICGAVTGTVSPSTFTAGSVGYGQAFAARVKP